MKSLVIENVEKAFTLIDDLAEDITITSKLRSGYDWSTSKIEDGNESRQWYEPELQPPTITLKCVVIKSYRSNIDSNPRIITEILIKSKDVENINLDDYDIVSLRNKNWNINDYENDGYTVKIKLGKAG